MVDLESHLLSVQIAELDDQAVEAATGAAADVPRADAGAEVVHLADQPSMPTSVLIDLLGQIASPRVPKQQTDDLLGGRVLHRQTIHQLLAGSNPP